MSQPQGEVFRAMLERVCASSGMAVVLTDDTGRVVWWNRYADEEFPFTFAAGKLFKEILEECTRLELGRMDPQAFERSSQFGDLRRAVNADGGTIIYRHVRLHLEEAGAGYTLHCLVNVSREKKLEESFLHNLRQLRSMREISDTLYESLSTQEVMYLILIAVTSQIGFGFNRAFFLEVGGSRLRGKIGIGPSNHEEAHQIWSRLAQLKFSSLREVYQDLTRAGGVPDARTQEIALRIDFPLAGPILPAAAGPAAARESSTSTHAAAAHAAEGAAAEAIPGILGVLARGKPAQIHSTDPGKEVDAALFALLGTESLAVVPLFVRGALRGVILADNLITRRPILEADLSLLKTFAGYAGVALERSHLYDELREHVAKLQSANESLKTNQEKLLHAEKLSAIGKLAAYVSHEIRNPLVGIGGLARSLLQDPIENAETVDTLQIIVSEVTRLERFLRETLDFVKPRITGTVLADLGGVVRDCLATFKNEISERSIEVEADLPRDPVEGLIDPDLLRHALANLIKNAIEAMDHGGKLHVGVERNGSVARIRVGDTGPGIPEDVRSRIFDPFFTTKPEGTGLGLAIASQNIRGLGGRLDLEADRRFKTLFKLTLPLDDGRSHVNAAAHRASPTILPQGTPILPQGAPTILPAANAKNSRQEAAALPLERN